MPAFALEAKLSLAAPIGAWIVGALTERTLIGNGADSSSNEAAARRAVDRFLGDDLAGAEPFPQVDRADVCSRSGSDRPSAEYAAYGSASGSA
jgi:hypothetical protein